MRNDRTIEGDEAGFPWLTALLLLSSVTLALQVFPSVWWWLLGVIDVRRWTWRSYATVSAIAIVALVALKAWLDRDN